MKKTRAEEAAINAEKRRFNLGSTVRGYFDHVIRVQDFVMAIDRTGVYFFTNEMNETIVLTKVSNYVEQLSLEKGEFVVCQVTNDAANTTEDQFFKRVYSKDNQEVLLHQVNPESFETTLRILIRNQGARLTAQDVSDIVECFYDDAADGALQKFLNEHDCHLDHRLVDKVEDMPIVTLQNIINFFGETNADEIFDLVAEFRQQNADKYKQLEKPQDHYKRVSLEVTVKTSTILGFLLFGLSVVMSLLKVPAFAAIFALAGLYQGRHLHLCYRSVIASVITWINVCALMFSTFSLILAFKPEIITFLQDTLLISR